MRSQFQSDFGPIVNRPFTMRDRNAVGQILRGLELQVQSQLQGLQNQMNQQQFIQQNLQTPNIPNPHMQHIQNPQMQNLPMQPQGQSMQGQGIQQGSFSQGIQTGPQGVQLPMNGPTFQPGNQGQGQMPQPPMQQNVPPPPTQFPQNRQMLQPIQQNAVPVGPQGQQFRPQTNGQMAQGPLSNQNIPVQPTAQMGMMTGRQSQGQQGLQGLQGRRIRRQAEPNCDKLRYDPETYCKTYESQCHNCTLEKRLRFEGTYVVSSLPRHEKTP